MPQEQSLRRNLSRRRSFRCGVDKDDRGWTTLHIGSRKGDLNQVSSFVFHLILLLNHFTTPITIAINYSVLTSSYLIFYDCLIIIAAYSIHLLMDQISYLTMLVFCTQKKRKREENASVRIPHTVVILEITCQTLKKLFHH